MTEPGVQKVNGWNKWSLHIQMELERLATDAVKRDEAIQAMRIDGAVKNATDEALRNAVEQNAEALKDLRDTLLPVMQNSIASLKVRAGLWGAVAGALPTAIAIIYNVVTSTSTPTP